MTLSMQLCFVAGAQSWWVYSKWSVAALPGQLDQQRPASEPLDHPETTAGLVTDPGESLATSNTGMYSWEARVVQHATKQGTNV